MWIEKGGQTVRAKFLCFLAAQEIRKTTARWRRFTAALPLSSGVNNQKPGEYIYRMSNKTRFTSQVSEKSWEKLAIKGSTAISLKTNEMVVAPSITTAIKAECPDIRRCNYIFRYGGTAEMSQCRFVIYQKTKSYFFSIPPAGRPLRLPRQWRTNCCSNQNRLHPLQWRLQLPDLGRSNRERICASSSIRGASAAIRCWCDGRGKRGD